jgi:hypothetical protein
MFQKEPVNNPSIEASTKWGSRTPTVRVVKIMITTTAVVTAAHQLGDALYAAWSWLDGLHILW